MITVKTREIHLTSKGNCHIIDLTEKVNEALHLEGFREGQVTIFVPGATAAISTVEYEPGLLRDLPEFFEKIIPTNGHYYHELTWHDGNGHSHVRATLMKPSLTVPFSNGELILGTWQQIVLLDFDNKPRPRRVILQFIGERDD